MSADYNPIVRTFCQFRVGLLECFDIPRRNIHPGTQLESVLPVTGRRDVWEHLRRQGLDLPPLERSRRDHQRNLLRVLRATASAALYLRSWYVLFLALPLAPCLYWLTRHRAVQIPLGLRTVGEAVICATCFAEHKQSGYRWTQNEIALKVRMIIADVYSVPLDAVCLETRLLDL